MKIIITDWRLQILKLNDLYAKIKGKRGWRALIIYTTKLLRERYKLKMPEDYTVNKDIVDAVLTKERGVRMLEWGAKLFYFDRRKCIQLSHFASKFTLFLCNIKVNDLAQIGDLICRYFYDIYSDDEKTLDLLERYFKSAPIVCFDKLTDKSAISTLNRTQLIFADDGYHFYEYIENGVLKTRQINEEVNTSWLFTRKINGKTEYFYPKDRFRELLEEWCKNNLI